MGVSQVRSEPAVGRVVVRVLVGDAFDVDVGVSRQCDAVSVAMASDSDTSSTTAPGMRPILTPREMKMLKGMSTSHQQIMRHTRRW